MSGNTVATLVLDSGAFIAGAAQLSKFGPSTRYVTTNGVLAELRDAATRHAVERFPFELQTRAVSDEAMSAVSAFAKQTGDHAALSATDLEIIALTYMLEKEANGLKNIRAEPRVRMDSLFLNNPVASSSSPPVAVESAVQFASFGAALPFQLDSFLSDGNSNPNCNSIAQSSSSLPDLAAFNGLPSFFHSESTERAQRATAADNDTDVAEVADEEIVKDAVSTFVAAAAVPIASAMLGWGLSGDETNEPDEGSWITADNIRNVPVHELVELDGVAAPTPIDVSSVAVVTTDFAMQNVLLQMGLRLLAVNGIAVTTLRSSIKRCYGCFRIERSMEREFCQHCGGHTLVRVAISVDSHGNLKWKQSNRQVFWKRGTIYSIPKPKRGELPMLLREDQLQVGRMRQLQNNKRRAEKLASRALLGADAHTPGGGGGGRGRAAAAPATKSLMEASAFAAEKVVSRGQELQYGFGKRNPNVHNKKK